MAIYSMNTAKKWPQDLLERRELGDDVERRYLAQFVKATADVRIQFTADRSV
jgi:hypothetical protein